jgi:phage terminase large subunit
MTTAVQEIIIPAPELRGAALELAHCHDPELGIDGPAGTGKTFGILYYIHILLLKYAGAKWLVTRRYNVDLAGSAMATYQNEVLDPNEGVYYYGGSKVKPAGYIYPNGSFMAVNGLDRPSRLKSFDADGIYINEATECGIEHIEYSRMRLRKGVMPWQQLIMDFNPDKPDHFLNQRMNAGVTRRLLSRHEDNPRIFD